MKNNIKTLILLSLLFFYSCMVSEVEEYTIIPQPVKIEYSMGMVRLKKQPDIAFPADLFSEAQLLQSYLNAEFSMQANLKEGKRNADIVLELDTALLTGQKEGYVLDAASRNIVIKGNSPAGVLNGIQTLRQIIKADGERFVVQKAVITDYPSFSWRAFMLDEGRYFKGKDVVFELLDNMSELKMNVFHWGLTNDQGWRIEIKKYPELIKVGAYRDSSEINNFHSNIFDGKPHGGFYTQDEIREIVDYATKRHIMIVPEINMPGHSSAAIASYPWLGTSGKQIKVPARFGVMYDVLNVADPRAVQFLEDVIDEVIALFPSSVIHIGGDEVRYNQWNESPFVQAYMKENNLKTPAELQVSFTNRMSNVLASKNRRMMGWNEITGARLHEYQAEEDAQGDVHLAKGTIVHFWKGDPGLIKETIEKGYEVVNSYHSYTYIDYSYESIPLKKSYEFNPVPEGLTAEQKKLVLGLGCQMWGEFIPTVESMNMKIYPRIAAYAETGWTGADNKDYQRFLNALEFFLKKWSDKGIVYGEVE